MRAYSTDASLYTYHLTPRVYNPIEEAFSKAKHILRKIGARGKEALIEATGQALGAVSTEDARGFGARRGYRAPAQQL